MNPRARSLALPVTMLVIVATAVALPSAPRALADTVDEVHYTYAGPTSVVFDWRGSSNNLQYGPTSSYGTTVLGVTPSPTPFSSPGPFWEAALTGLDVGATYHYSIGGGPDHAFSTTPTGAFRFDAEADIGSSINSGNVGAIQSQIAADSPAFVLMSGDLTYGNPDGQGAVDQHFNDVMAWSQAAAYMPAWGNHEWESPTLDDLRNYKGRFALPNAQTSPGAPAPGCCGEDWGWFDAGGVRFISYPEPYTSATWPDWQTKADPIMSAAQADPTINFIVTFGHRPAYSTGSHLGDPNLANILDGFGAKYSKYVLNLNGHSHDYERFQPIQHVIHETTGGGGEAVEPPWLGSDARTVFRAFHLEHLRVDVDATGMRVDTICGPATAKDDLVCEQGSVMDSVVIGISPPTPFTTLYVDRNNPDCSDTGGGTASQPYCRIGPAAARAFAGQTVQVASGTYAENITVGNSGTAGAPIVFTAAPGAFVQVSGQTHGFTVTNRSYITIQGFTVTGTSGDGIYITGASHVVVTGNHVTYAGLPQNGFVAKGIRLSTTNDSVVSDNSVDHNTDSGIFLSSGSTRDQIVGNYTSFNAQVWQRAAPGIDIRSPGNKISSNVSHDNEDSGIQFYSGANGNFAVDNVVYGNGDHGIDNYNSTGMVIVGNTVYKNSTSGINLEGTTGSFGATLANNISVDNAISSPRTKGDIRVDSASTANTRIDHDLVFLKVSGTLFTWGSQTYSSLPQFRSATGMETQGVQADPRWSNQDAADFHLKAGSPAIDSADAAVLGQPIIDADSGPRVDDPSTVNTGTGARTYDDRGAFEFQPSLPGDAPPLARLVVSPASGVSPLAVTADASSSTDTDSTPIATYKFDFGDGTTPVGPQAGATATHSFSKAGTYTVAATVTDTAGQASAITSQVIVTDLAPAAGLSVSPSSGTIPLRVTADASASTDTDGTPIATYTFDFGDGTTPVGPQAGATATHTFSTPGTYTVTVTVTDTAGQSASATAAVVATTVDAPPSASLTTSPSSGPAPLLVTADASESTDTDGTPIATYTFDFGDGTTPVGPQAGATATHTFSTPGTYTVTVTVTDTAGLSSTATGQVTAADLPPHASLTTSPSSGPAPLLVTADASESTDTDGTPIATYTFDFGDGTTPVGPQAGATATHTFSTAGTYTVAVTVTDTAGLSSTATGQLVAGPGDSPPAAALSTLPSSGLAPVAVTADASASTDTDGTPVATYTFNFGDGSAVGPQAASSAAHTFDRVGTYTVTVTVTDTAGLSSSATAQVVAQDAPPASRLSVSPSSGTVALNVTADASASTDTDGTPIASYTFNWGDGTTPTGPRAGATASHSYVAAGTYTITLTAVDTAGLLATATAQVTVTDVPPAAAVSVSPSIGVAPLATSADASASSDPDGTPIATYTFDFADGSAQVGPQSSPTAEHTYAAPGSYTVTVTVKDTAGLSSVATATASVKPNLVGNPGFEVDTSKWNTQDAAVTLSRVAGGHTGGWAAKLVNTSTPRSCTLNDSPDWVSKTSLGTYVGGIWVRADTAGALLKLRFREYNGTSLVGSQTTQVTLTTSWQQVTVRYSPVVPGSSTLDFNAYVGSAATGTCFYADDASIYMGS